MRDWMPTRSVHLAGAAPIHLAAAQGHAPVIELLIAANADANIRPLPK